MVAKNITPEIEVAENGDPSPSVPFQRKYRTDFWTRKREIPTYEVVGKVERFDMRDILNYRAALIPGTERYRDYYSRHPEREEKDKKFRMFPSAQAREKRRHSLFRDEPLALALSNACKVAYLLRTSGNGPVAEQKVDLDPQTAAMNIKGVARYLGADLVGICELNPAWVYSYCGTDDIPGLQWGDPIQFPHRYAIVIAAAHNFEMLLSGRGIGLTTTIETNEVAFSKVAVPALRLASYIRALGYPAEAHIMGGKVNSVPVAVDAGLG